MQKFLVVTLCCAMSGIAACTWVKPAPQSEQVRVLTADQVRDCTEAGNTHVSVMDKVGVLRRSEDKVAGELRALARNSAVQLGGNAVVPLTDIINGTQTFAVYKCPAGAR